VVLTTVSTRGMHSVTTEDEMDERAGVLRLKDRHVHFLSSSAFCPRAVSMPSFFSSLSHVHTALCSLAFSLLNFAGRPSLSLALPSLSFLLFTRFHQLTSIFLPNPSTRLTDAPASSSSYSHPLPTLSYPAHAPSSSPPSPHVTPCNRFSRLRTSARETEKEGKATSARSEGAPEHPA
jgi:hypothetical protein